MIPLLLEKLPWLLLEILPRCMYYLSPLLHKQDMHNEYWKISDTELLCVFFLPGIRFWFLIVAMLCLVEDEG